MDPVALSASELSVLYLELRPFTIPGAGKGLFTTRPIRKGEQIGYYYGTLVYDNIGIGSRTTTATYGSGVLAFHASTFNKWAFESRYKAMDRNNNQYPVWIYPAPFCAMKYINDPRHVDPDTSVASASPYRSPNAQFVDFREPETAADFRLFTCITVIATENIPTN